jgi:hypothetical protein
MLSIVTRNALRTGPGSRATATLFPRYKSSKPTSPYITMIPPQTRSQADPVLQKWSDDDPGHDVQGPGHGKHTKRTLASLSMEGKVCVVTGAGRGLGNMMARTFVESYGYFCFMRTVLISRGASAIVLVDLNKADAEAAAKDLTDWFGKSAICSSLRKADSQSSTERPHQEKSRLWV